MTISEEFGLKYNETSKFNYLLMNSDEEAWMSFMPFCISSDVFELLKFQPLVMSIMGSVIVGLSGILPLLVIPIDDTITLKSGTGANTLRLLLSFAVGGLLGDVFLHLLPEAWGNHYSNSIRLQSIFSKTFKIKERRLR